MIPFEFSKTNCHRCGFSFTKSQISNGSPYLRCQCGMWINDIDLDTDTILTIYLDLGQCGIFWTNDGYCFVEFDETPSITLPWMPFDITEDQLEIYVTFS